MTFSATYSAPRTTPGRSLASQLAKLAAQRLASDPELASLAYGAPEWDLPSFIVRTKIEVPHEAATSIVPFELWPAQRETVLPALERERLAVFLKARQLGISWLVCGWALHRCVTAPAQTFLFFSQGLTEANELIRRVAFLRDQHEDRARFPALTKDNTDVIAWANGSRIRSLPATKKAGRSFTASAVVLDEFAFMLYGPALLAAVKPTIDAGGQLVIISSADGNGTPYHQLWNGAEAGTSGFTPIFLPWTARPDRDPGWRDRIAAESPELTQADVLREYPATPGEAFANAVGLVYGNAYRDGEGGNVTDDAEYVAGAGPVYWLLDDGYSAGSASKTAGLDPHTGMYVADSHPRVILWAQLKPDGHLDVFAESYACLRLSDDHLDEAQRAGYPDPEYVIHGPGAAEIRGRIFEVGHQPLFSGPDVAESIKELRRGLAADRNGWRRVRIHPRCQQLRCELLAYRNDLAGKPIKAFDHGPDALRVGLWALRGQL